MDICDRINQIIEQEGFTIASFARKIGVGDQTVRGVVIQRRNKPGYDFILKIAQTFEWLNIDWLITGQGDMKVTGQPVSVSPTGTPSGSLSEIVEYLREKDHKIEQLIEEKSMWKHKYLMLHENKLKV